MPYQPGEILLDKYRVESLLGQGAFGEVYKVTHLALGITRALKVLRADAPGVGSTIYIDAQSRFNMEARLGARLNNPVPSPHLLQVYDVIISDRLSLLEMEYAPGGSLAERIKKASDTGIPIAINDAVQIAQDVAKGLEKLHDIDIVHRDLKPSNILLDGQGHARVADLGLAQVPGGSLRSKLSNPVPHPGTPGYMSPEQERSSAVLKPPSDIYALGLVLFEMLTGRNYTFLEPGTRARSLRRATPIILDDLLLNMLSSVPENRPWNGEKAALALSNLLVKPGNLVPESTNSAERAVPIDVEPGILFQKYWIAAVVVFISIAAIVISTIMLINRQPGYVNQIITTAIPTESVDNNNSNPDPGNPSTATPDQIPASATISPTMGITNIPQPTAVPATIAPTPQLDPFMNNCINSSVWSPEISAGTQDPGCLVLNPWGITAIQGGLEISNGGVSNRIRQGIYMPIRSGTRISFQMVVSTLNTPLDNDLANISMGIVSRSSRTFITDRLLLYQRESPNTGYPIFLKSQERSGDYSSYLLQNGVYWRYAELTPHYIVVELTDADQMNISIDGVQVISSPAGFSDKVFWIGYLLPQNGQIKAEITNFTVSP